MLVTIDQLNKLPFAKFLNDYPQFNIKAGDLVSTHESKFIGYYDEGDTKLDVSIKVDGLIAKEFIDIIITNFNEASAEFISTNLYVNCDLQCAQSILHKAFKILYHLALDYECIENALMLLYLDESNHGINVGIISAFLALKSERYDLQSIIHIVAGAFLHDMCWIYSKPFITNDMSVAEYERYIKHPAEAYTLIKDLPNLPDASKKIVLMHHVWLEPALSYRKGFKYSFPDSYDGKVFLHTARDISIGIVQVADDYDLLTNPYFVPVVDKKEVIEKLYSQQYTKYGSAAEIFYYNFTPYKIGSEVVLSNNKIAQVIEYTNIVDKPIVKVRSIFRNYTLDLSKTKIHIKQEVT